MSFLYSFCLKNFISHFLQSTSTGNNISWIGLNVLCFTFSFERYFAGYRILVSCSSCITLRLPLYILLACIGSDKKLVVILHSSICIKNVSFIVGFYSWLNKICLWCVCMFCIYPDFCGPLSLGLWFDLLNHIWILLSIFLLIVLLYHSLSSLWDSSSSFDRVPAFLEALLCFHPLHFKKITFYLILGNFS